MKSSVFLVRTEQNETEESVKNKLRHLLQESEIFAFISAGQRAVIKLHFGEEGNTGFVKADYCAVIVNAVKERHAEAFLCDTNTLYRGKRTNSRDHLALAYRHGFKPEKIGAGVVIPDDTKKENVLEVSYNGKYVKTALIARVFQEADVLVGVAHFKGHLMTGFGGAIKNIGMGCATRAGKLFQHSGIAPHVYGTKCKACRACIEICPAEAVTLVKDKATIDSSRCIGCAQCIAACKYGAMDVQWEFGGDLIQEKMAEYAAAVLKGKKGSCAFFNFCIKITGECDCLAKDDPRIAPDIGILASNDPVALDAACGDLVRAAAGRDVFKEAHPKRDGSKQLAHAQSVGIGSVEYTLREL